jgi:hypothetical protein
MVITRAPFLAEEVAGIVLALLRSLLGCVQFDVDAHLLTGTQHYHLRPVKSGRHGYPNHQRLWDDSIYNCSY